jgi:acetyltransferase-like isoleucine patch superfamily enzyme
MPETKIWGVQNIYPTAEIGDNGSIGWFCEIGNNVKIGDRVRIGAFSYLPEGVIVEDDVFIGPRLTCTNDKYPPSGKEHWKKTVIKKGARIGAGVTIICGVTIGEGSLVGAGSLVTKNIGEGEKWYGVPARKR